MNQIPKRKKQIFLFLLFPWLLLAPMLLYMEVKKLHLQETFSLNPPARKAFYLKIAMPGLEDDYFQLLNRAKKLFQNERLKYGIIMDDDLSAFVRLMCRAYSTYELSPARPASQQQDVVFKLYYRSNPQEPADNIVAIISGAKPSYIVKTVLK